MVEKPFTIYCEIPPYKKQIVYLIPGPVLDGRFHYFFRGCDNASGCKACNICAQSMVEILEKNPDFHPTQPFIPSEFLKTLD